MTDETLCGLNFYEGKTFQIYTTELNTSELWPVDVVIAMKKNALYFTKHELEWIGTTLKSSSHGKMKHLWRCSVGVLKQL